MIFHSRNNFMAYFQINKGSSNYYSLAIVLTVCFNMTTLVNVYTAVFIVLVYN
jgi:hypothetical protein